MLIVRATLSCMSLYEKLKDKGFGGGNIEKATNFQDKNEIT